MLLLRRAEPKDLPMLAQLFRQTVLTHAPCYYTPAQTMAWAALPLNAERFRRFVLDVTTYIAVEDAVVLGFAGVSENGHIASVYVGHGCLHQGIGSVLMETLLDHASRHGIERLYGEASEFSRGLFQKFGFCHYDTEVVDRNGVKFQRYLVEKWLFPRPSP